MVVNLADAHFASGTGRNTLLKLKLFAVDVDLKKKDKTKIKFFLKQIS